MLPAGFGTCLVRDAIAIGPRMRIHGARYTVLRVVARARAADTYDYCNVCDTKAARARERPRRAKCTPTAMHDPPWDQRTGAPMARLTRADPGDARENKARPNGSHQHYVPRGHTW